MRRKLSWQAALWLSVLALSAVLMIRSDLSQLHWVSALSAEGSPPPARDSSSPTGYALGQRSLLGTHDRGETYRWIALTQDFVASGFVVSSSYQADTVPAGRPRLQPSLYTAWLAGISWGIHTVTGEPMALSAERAALWEPVISHLLAFVSVVTFMWLRYGAVTAGVAGLFFVLYPPLSGQFLPGVLTAKTWALLLAAYAIALNLPRGGDHRESRALSVRSTLAAGLALWLDPAFGFPAVLLSAGTNGALLLAPGAQLPWLRWSCIGSAVTLAAWLVDRSPWNPIAGELRYVHPLYALAWLGLGLGMHGVQSLRAVVSLRKKAVAEIAAAVALLSPLVYTQFHEGYKGWLYPSAALRRLTSLDETLVFGHAIDWLAHASFVEAALVSTPALLAIAVVATALWRRHKVQGRREPAAVAVAVLLTSLLALAFFEVRWGVIVALVSLPLVASLASSASVAVRRGLLAVAAVFLLALFASARLLPTSLQKPVVGTPLGPADLEALIDRHFSYWIATHNPGQRVTVLAPPELSDSLVFHGGCRVLMSTAWESYPGQVAASRVLSAPESSEAEAILQSREITHVILPSWDRVLPLLVHTPEAGKDTLYARLLRWVHPLYLRPLPYRLPRVAGYLDQKLAVFKVTAPQDEALSLSRLAEYFVEMDRAEPAGLVAKVLAESFRDDPNAAIARALVYAQAQNQTAFDREVTRLAADASEGKAPLAWDRRVQRAIVLALGRRPALARTEIEACMATASRDALFELTPLQAYRLHALATHFEVNSPPGELAQLLASLGAEFSSASTNSAPH